MTETQLPVYNVYNSISKNVIVKDRAGESVVKRQVTPKPFNDLLSDIYAFRTSILDKPFELRAMQGNFDCLFKIAKAFKLQEQVYLHKESKDGKVFINMKCTVENVPPLTEILFNRFSKRLQ